MIANSRKLFLFIGLLISVFTVFMGTFHTENHFRKELSAYPHHISTNGHQRVAHLQRNRTRPTSNRGSKPSRSRLEPGRPSASPVKAILPATEKTSRHASETSVQEQSSPASTAAVRRAKPEDALPSIVGTGEVHHTREKLDRPGNPREQGSHPRTDAPYESTTTSQVPAGSHDPKQPQARSSRVKDQPLPARSAPDHNSESAHHDERSSAKAGGNTSHAPKPSPPLAARPSVVRGKETPPPSILADDVLALETGIVNRFEDWLTKAKETITAEEEHAGAANVSDSELPEDDDADESDLMEGARSVALLQSQEEPSKPRVDTVHRSFGVPRPPAAIGARAASHTDRGSPAQLQKRRDPGATWWGQSKGGSEERAHEEKPVFPADRPLRSVTAHAAPTPAETRSFGTSDDELERDVSNYEVQKILAFRKPHRGPFFRLAWPPHPRNHTPRGSELRPVHVQLHAKQFKEDGRIHVFKNHRLQSYVEYVTEKADERRVLQRYLFHDSLVPMLPHSDFDKRHPTCAVVSNSGELLRRPYGREIDRADAVFRINYPPVRGFSMFVGSKCTYEMTNSHHAQLIADPHGYDLVPKGTKSFRAPEGNPDGGTATLVLTETPNSEGWRFNMFPQILRRFSSPKTMLLSPDILAAGEETWRKLAAELGGDIRCRAIERRGTSSGSFCKPTTGWIALIFAMQICDRVTMYGFSSWRKHASTHQAKYHYFDNATGVTNVHSFDLSLRIYHKLAQHYPITLK
ncbi:glycosyltransferase 29 protein [Cymbomonas tetramitiformis]|uniref:Glycosyltransferase 29 protein n=1 Tax=Cymbomonas tetramitiformis TaxID=36881 RepID=A0AAE0C2P4_9CHLO|nr:glycosyltransferase 29 protein [Cymbomonas tetramitiformis]